MLQITAVNRPCFRSSSRLICPCKEPCQSEIAYRWLCAAVPCRDTATTGQRIGLAFLTVSTLAMNALNIKASKTLLMRTSIATDTPPPKKAADTGKRTELLFRALINRVAIRWNRWRFVSFRGAGAVNLSAPSIY